MKITRSLLQFAIFILTVILLYISCKPEYSCEDCPHLNKPPIADAGPDKIITLPEDSVLLNGSASTNSDGIIISYLWTKISGSDSFTIIKASAVKTIIKDLKAGTYQLELTVTDNGGLSAKDTMNITVDSVVTPNHPPIANVNADTTIVLPTDSVLLNGDISYDPDGQIVDYQWTKISGPVSFNIANSQSVQTKVNHLVEGVYEFELTVKDNTGLFARDTIQVTVKIASSVNLPPVANAGPDISLNYNLQTCSITPFIVTLNGSASSDPDGNIIDYSWRQLPGPPMATITNPSSMNTQVANFEMGTYYFVLTVTDNNHAADEDTVAVKINSLMNRPIVQAQLIPVGKLSQLRENIAIAFAGGKILFTGGFLASSANPEKSRVDIYDITNNIWSTAELSQARYNMGVAVYQNKIYFAGGNYSNSASLEIPSNRIDIYDASANSWSIDSLSAARLPIGASVNDKILFAGGSISDPAPVSVNTDIFNTTSGSWSVGVLSVGRRIFSATTIGTKVFFAGGENANGLTGNIDIYDAASDSWIVSSFSAPFNQGWATNGIAVGNKNYWAGGIYSQATSQVSYTNRVEIRDEGIHSSSFGCLFQPNNSFSIVLKNNKIVFFTGTGVEKNKLDIYDIANNTWSIGTLAQNIQGASIISVNSIIYIAGGYINGILSDQVWKLEF